MCRCRKIQNYKICILNLNVNKHVTREQDNVNVWRVTGYVGGQHYVAGVCLAGEWVWLPTYFHGLLCPLWTTQTCLPISVTDQCCQSNSLHLASKSLSTTTALLQSDDRLYNTLKVSIKTVVLMMEINLLN